MAEPLFPVSSDGRACPALLTLWAGRFPGEGSDLDVELVGGPSFWTVWFPPGCDPNELISQLTDLIKNGAPETRDPPSRCPIFKPPRHAFNAQDGICRANALVTLGVSRPPEEAPRLLERRRRAAELALGARLIPLSPAALFTAQILRSSVAAFDGASQDAQALAQACEEGRSREAGASPEPTAPRRL